MEKWARKGEPVEPRPVVEYLVVPRQNGKTATPVPPSIALLLPKAACTDCGSTSRKLTQVSPKVLLCATDIRERKKAKRLKSKARRQERVYGITLEEKEALIEFQGGGCVCKPWTGYNGNSRSLSTDHDHATGVVRGALCKHCNDLLGRVEDDIEYFRRMIRYLEDPPAVKFLGRRIAPEG